jgi:hypothetical protein
MKSIASSAALHPVNTPTVRNISITSGIDPAPSRHVTCFSSPNGLRPLQFHCNLYTVLYLSPCIIFQNRTLSPYRMEAWFLNR